MTSIQRKNYLQWVPRYGPKYLKYRNLVWQAEFWHTLVSYKGSCQYQRGKKVRPKMNKIVFQLLELLFYTLIQLDIICQD